MKLIAHEIRLSATDLANYLACRHLTTLDHGAALGHLEPPSWRDPLLEVLQERGMEHEQAYLDHLRDTGLQVVELDQESAAGAGFVATREAIHAGHDVISQATLTEGRWHGRADVLVKVDGESALGDYHYEVVDTKLARNTKAGTVLQLCVYSAVLESMQGRRPASMHVVKPGVNFARESYRTCDYLAYYRLVKGSLEEAVETYETKATYPEPNPHCEICRWWSDCRARWRADDHLSLVAGISRLQRKELVDGWGIDTLEALADLPLPLDRRPDRGVTESYVKVREQARVQLEGRQRGGPVHELLEREEDRGLARLPEPSPGDIFFDIEGDRFAGDGGFEYLLAFVETDGESEPRYLRRWAVDKKEERAAFEWFVDEVMERWERHPDMHVYHYAPYEPSAMKCLMGRYATREEEVDRMLRAGVFVDLHGVVKESVRASVERYSIKDLEQFYGFEREAELRDANRHLHGFERALELGRLPQVARETFDMIEAYNRDDCRSTLALRDWLEGLRTSLLEAGEEIFRPSVEDGKPPEDLDARQKEIQALKSRLTEGVSDDTDERSPEEHGRWLLAALLEWHRREEKAAWWEYFRLKDLPEEEYLYEKSALYGLEFLERVGGKDSHPVHRYRYPEQDADIRKGDTPHVGEESIGVVYEHDPRNRTVDIRKKKTHKDFHPAGFFVHDLVRADCLRDALFRLGEWTASQGIEHAGYGHRAERDLLLKGPPRLFPGTPLNRDGEENLKQARRLAVALDRGVLPIQGPPGAGKTYTGARIALDLVRAGKTVGVTAVSHKAIRNLLDTIVEAAEEEEDERGDRPEISIIQKVGNKSEEEPPLITETTSNPPVRDALAEGEANIGAGTAWLWAREDMAEAVDVLFIDEAGQMSLANALAAAQGAKSLVLLGDPQQLEQPLQGSHPEGAEASVLQHVLGEHQTIPEDRGLFLPHTYRLHPDITEFTSEVFYEDRLTSVEGLARQLVHGDIPFSGAGLWFVPVEHEGNQNSSPEEAAVVAELLGVLDGGHVRWTNEDGAERVLGLEDVLVVAPYNAQVGEIGRHFPGCRVGTVDKFQGQEAPVVIYSMATSSPEEAPRGMEFLYSLNRLNVASSRARSCCIIVANPGLFEPECRTPRQMQLANAFCRYVEMAKRIKAAANTGRHDDWVLPFARKYGMEDDLLR